MKRDAIDDLKYLLNDARHHGRDERESPKSLVVDSLRKFLREIGEEASDRIISELLEDF